MTTETKILSSAWKWPHADIQRKEGTRMPPTRCMIFSPSSGDRNARRPPSVFLPLRIRQCLVRTYDEVGTAATAAAILFLLFPPSRATVPYLITYRVLCTVRSFGDTVLYVLWAKYQCCWQCSNLNRKIARTVCTEGLFCFCPILFRLCAGVQFPRWALPSK